MCVVWLYEVNNVTGNDGNLFEYYFPSKTFSRLEHWLCHPFFMLSHWPQHSVMQWIQNKVVKGISPEKIIKFDEFKTKEQRNNSKTELVLKIRDVADSLAFGRCADTISHMKIFHLKMKKAQIEMRFREIIYDKPDNVDERQQKKLFCIQSECREMREKSSNEKIGQDNERMKRRTKKNVFAYPVITPRWCHLLLNWRQPKQKRNPKSHASACDESGKNKKLSQWPQALSHTHTRRTTKK